MTGAEAIPETAGRGEFTMAELVERTGVASATIRYYLSAGLLPSPEKVAANRFLYDVRHVELIKFIRVLHERRGFSLEDIGRLLPEIVPDLVGQPPGGVFRPEMWGQLLAPPNRVDAAPSSAERLLEAGLTAFSRHGYAEVSVDDVCRAAGLAKGSFYRHYASKEELFFAAAERAGVLAATELVLANEHDLDAAVAVLADALATHVIIWLDLASLAAQRRPGHARVLRALTVEVRRVGRERFPDADDESLDAIFDRAIVLAVRRAVDDQAGGHPLAELHVHDAVG